MTKMEEYRKGLDQSLADSLQIVEQLESGRMTVFEKIGDGPQRDVTQESLERNKRAVATYQKILKAIDEGKLADL